MITKDQAVNLSHGTILIHKEWKNANGDPVRCRVNGKCQTWKMNKTRFKLPVKYGLYDCFYITLENAEEWNVKT